MDNKERNQKVISQQQARLKKQSEQAAATEKIENMSIDQLKAALSNKNADFLFRLDKFLLEEGWSKEETQQKIDSMLQEIVIAQRKGQTAASLYDQSPKELAHELVHPKPKPRPLTFWEKAVDNILLYLAIFTGMIGLFSLFATSAKAQSQTQVGIVTLIIIGVICGLGITYFNDVVTLKKEDRPSTWKLILTGAGLIVCLFLVFIMFALPPLKYINPTIPSWSELVIMAVALLGRWAYRRLKGIKSTAAGLHR
ncbi:MAG: DUF1129 domain-containing protein [Lactobacillus sp.]|jgi:uncharacterized membrane-anchored protein|nr:DUF1129 domain-containing protein [Lactobacillus sp.]MCH3990844.1 DUF1129 domain-containing protein [Lactobacillus sp.]MCH4068440.1 DUF1129 domain-containing protein [Lactobacillus sp.]MCI1304189.1 DUF1129 domain-containing protein [Lactobacillus sp.]MCI1330510.1 DUF1129 domain-containing protein [Lactobacillus sp.]